MTDPSSSNLTPDTTPDPASNPAPTDTPPRRKRPRWPWLLVVVVLLLCAALLAPALRQHVPWLRDWWPVAEFATTSVEEELAALDSGLSSLAQRLDVEEQRRAAIAEDVMTHGMTLTDLERRLLAVERRANFAAASPGEAMGASVAARVDSLAARLAQVEARLAAMADDVRDAASAAQALQDQLALQDRLTMELSGQEERLARLEQSASADGRGAVIAIAFSTLRDVANRGRPFSLEYETLHDLLSDARRGDLAAQLRAIAPYAASGASTLAMLRAAFAESVPDILEASRAPEGSSWWRRFTAKLANLVIVRPTGDAAGPEPAAIVARLERRLAGNDLAGALVEFGNLPSTAQEAAGGWAAEARKRLALDEAMGGFAATLLREVAAGGFSAQRADTAQPTP